MMEPLQKSSSDVNVNKDRSTYEAKNSNHLRQLRGRQWIKRPEVNGIQLLQ